MLYTIISSTTNRHQDGHERGRREDPGDRTGILLTITTSTI